MEEGSRNNRDLDDIEKRSGDYCPFSQRLCNERCKMYDSITDECLFWLMNSNLYHLREELSEMNGDSHE